MKKATMILSLATTLFIIGCGPNKEKSRTYLERGVEYMYHSQLDEALENIEKAIKCYPENSEAYYYRGCVKTNNLKYEEGRLDFEKAVELNPKYADAYFNLGLYYRRLNDYSMACYYFKQAEALGRDNMEDYTKFCKYYE